MQNFKQYLLEETSKECTLECVYYFPFTVRGYDNLNKTLIKKAVYNILKGFSYSIENVSDQSFNILIDNPDSNLLKSKSNQIKFHEKVMKAVGDAIGENYIDVINNQLFQCYCNIYTNYIPTFPVECEFFRLTVTPDLKLTGIHKVLNCLQLQLMRFEKFKGGGLLSLLKLKQTITVRVMFGRSRKIFPQLAQAWDIVQRHFEGNKDIIACQRELIENDLDEYAEL